MAVPDDRRYSDSHEWFRPEGDLVAIGLTAFAVEQLTDVTYVEMREAGFSFDAGDIIGEVESVKATSDVYSSIGGEIVEVNSAVADDPSLLNKDAFDAWLVRIRPAGDLEDLMDAEAYQKHVDDA